MKAEIRLTNGDASVVVDGNEMRYISSINVYGSADGTNELTLVVILREFDVTVDGRIIVNATPITDEFGRAIYESLKQRYETDLA
jgi:hypothetical protein